MKTSKDRILTTHAGSLPRTDKLAKLLIERDNDLPVDETEMRREVERATDWLVAKQLESGVDIGSDGEAARVGFQTYVSLRLSGGWGGVSPRKGMTDIAKFPKYGEILKQAPRTSRRIDGQAVQLLPMPARRALSTRSGRREDGAAIVCRIAAPQSEEVRRDLRDRRLAGDHHDHVPARRGQSRLQDR